MSAPVVWSYGGGVQTAAIGVAVVTGRLPKPDIAVIADTGREATETWEYLDAVMRPYLRRAGVEVEVAPHSLATVDLYSHGGDMLLPAYTADGRLPAFCSNEWKVFVVRRWLRQRRVESCRLWLGISTDEMKRIRQSGKAWVEHAFPLIDPLRMSRAECLALVESAGLPAPPKSSCWMCPHRGDPQWRRLRDHYPEDWRKACELDEQIRAADTQGGVWLHRSRVPLALADLGEDAAPELNLFSQCDSGHCWT
jgi:hypothetical protein